MILYIKHVINIRNRIDVKANLEELGLICIAINFGEVEILGKISMEQRKLLRVSLLRAGFELMENKKVILIEKVKKTIINMVLHMEEMPKTKNSDYIKNILNRDYSYLSNIFSEIMGSTIEHYVITQKIERVKELLLFDEFTLTQISYKLNYSSVAHLSTQFKKITGYTPSEFKQIAYKLNSSLIKQL